MAASGNISKQLAKMGAEFMEFIKHSKSFESALKTGRIISASPGKVEFELDIEKGHTNPHEFMHGAFTALLVDNITSAAIVSLGKVHKPGHPFFSGVSVNMNISYFRPGKLGETVVTKAEVLKLGKTLAFTACEITGKSDGKIIATGQHTKYIA